MKKINTYITIFFFFFSIIFCGKTSNAEENLNSHFNHIYQWSLTCLGVDDIWKKSTGKNTIIAFIDSGIDIKSPHFREKIVRPYNVIDKNDDVSDETGHGTFISSVAAAFPFSDNVISGIAPESKIMPVKIFKKDYSPDANTVADAIIWATDNGADIINLSFGTNENYEVIKKAINYAYSRNKIIISSAGNDNQLTFNYPARYEKSLAVLAVGYNGHLLPFSNKDLKLCIYAPGENILGQNSTGSLDPQYESYDGTSLATAVVSGLVSLIKSYNPSLNNEDIYSILYLNMSTPWLNKFEKFFEHIDKTYERRN